MRRSLQKKDARRHRVFDEDFFAYCEDTDLGLRARLSGVGNRFGSVRRYLSLLFRDSGKIHAFKGVSCRKKPPVGGGKNLPLSMLLLSPFYTLARYFTQLYGVISGKGAGGKAKEEYPVSSLFYSVVKAYYDGIKNFR